MPLRRSDIVDAENPGVYHCISRCVRREALLASRARRDWIVSRLRFLADRLAVDVISFAVMQNHLHLLLRIRPELVRCWSDREVAERHLSILPNRRRRERSGIAPDAPPTEAEIDAIQASPRLLARARADLSSLGFFHRLLKEPCARSWNREDGVTGHFWEGRFLSPRVLDDASILRVSRYIELNEVRACSADSIPQSIWTSARLQWERLREALRALVDSSGDPIEIRLERVLWEPVFPCAAGRTTAGHPREPTHHRSETSLANYIAALDADGRRPHQRKPGRILCALTAIAEARCDLRALLVDVGSTQAVEQAKRLWNALERYCSGAAIDMSAAALAGAWIASPVASRPKGSCYGEAGSLEAEARRRGRQRVIPIREHAVARYPARTGDAVS